MKKFIFSLLVVLLVSAAVFSFVGCQKEAAEASSVPEAAQSAEVESSEAPQAAEAEAPAPQEEMRGPYEDGSYFAMDEEFSRGWKAVASFTVEKGYITDAIWTAVSPVAGADKIAYSKAGLYGMAWAEQAEKAAAYLVETQDPAAISYKDDEGHTDDIAGVSVHVIEFFNLVEKALEAGPVEPGYLEDGAYYKFADEFAGSGWKEYVALTVVGGKIASVNWSAVDRDGNDKKAYDAAGNYNMVAYGGAQAEWSEQAKAAEDYLIETQNPTAVTYKDDEGHTDDIAGVSIHVNSLFDLALEALADGPKAIGPYADGSYYAISDESGNGWTEYVSLFVINGNIGSVYWSALSDEGEDKKVFDKEGNYGMVAYGGAQDEWYVQAGRAEAYLLETQDPAAVTYADDEGHTDDIAGVSIHVNGLFDLAAAALEAGPVTE